MPPFLLGAVRFLAAGFLMLVWCIIKKEPIWNVGQLKSAAVSGVLMLFIGNGAIIWAEKTLPSSLVAILVSAIPIWFVLLDKPKWKENLTNRRTILSLVIGFGGVILLYSEQTAKAFSSSVGQPQLLSLVVLLAGSISWAGGSLYSKYKGYRSGTVNTAWQMLAAGFAFISASLLGNESQGFEWKAVSSEAWIALAYLILMGSLAAYSAYVWLLQVRPVTQVSSYGYVNPIVAVVLGVYFADEQLGALQLAGLAVIITSVLLINWADRGNIRHKVKSATRSRNLKKI